MLSHLFWQESDSGIFKKLEFRLYLWPWARIQTPTLHPCVQLV